MILKDKSKKELIELCIRFMGNNERLKNANTTKTAQVRHFRIRLKKIRDSLDYLLKHPFSNDTGFTTKKDKRDIPKNQSNKYKE